MSGEEGSFAARKKTAPPQASVHAPKNWRGSRRYGDDGDVLEEAASPPRSEADEHRSNANEKRMTTRAT
jgi:hypothetical protein